MQTTVEETPTPAIDRGGVPSTWAGLLEAYRIGPKQQWSGLLVERLGPWLTAARRQLHAVPPYLDQDDVAQQLILEVLQIASRWRPICEGPLDPAPAGRAGGAQAPEVTAGRAA